MTTQHDYKSALEDIQEGTFSHGNLTYETILHALEVCKSLQNGPSEGMEKAGWKTNGEPTETFNAMIKQLYKEISDDR